jgi:hypothetical protein
MSLRPSQAELVVVVSRHPKPPFGFRWEIRRFSYGVALERASRSYSTEDQARQAGDDALAVLRRSVAWD